MNEKDYIELQNLLIKLRVIQFKIYGNIQNETKKRERALKIINRIDYLRTHIEMESGENGQI